MWSDVKAAARDGILVGVKYGIAAALVLAAVSWMLGDYTTVRQRAHNGQVAFEFLQQQAAKAANGPQKPVQ